MHAIMIMCHKNWTQVERLIRHVKSAETDVFVHVDSKYTEWKEPAVKMNLYFTRHRFSGKLDDRSLVDITMEMIRRAKEVEQTEGKHYKYYVLLSGQDYPVKPISYINEQLRNVYPQPLIDCTPWASDNWIYFKYCYNPSVSRGYAWMHGIKAKVVRTPIHVALVVYRKLVKLFHVTDFDWFARRGISLYGGSAWWALPDTVINFFLETWEDPIHQRLLQSVTPEESWFQTVTMRSSLADRVELNSPEAMNQNCKTWAYFVDEGKPFNGHPYIFTVDLFDRLINSPWWFARKFDVEVDSVVLDMLDEYLEKMEHQKLKDSQASSERNI